VNDDTPEPGMAKETIALPDGRYLIYYTFPEDGDAPNGDTTASAPNVTASRPNVILSLSKDEPTP
jgi:hypothetical protein